MSAARDQILAGIRRRLGKPAGNPAEGDRPDLAAARSRLAAHRRNLVPARAEGDAAARLALFARMAEFASASLERLPSMAAVPAAVANYLRAENLPARLVQAPALDRLLSWSGQPALEVRAGVPAMEDETGLALAFAGVAETGTLVMLSGAETPGTLNFVPDTQIVVLRAGDVVGSYEDGFDRLRAGPGADAMPRSLTMITGPSRTGDIEQQIVVGAHGPRRLHVLLVGAPDGGE